MNIAAKILFFNYLCLCFLCVAPAWADTRVIDHRMQVHLDPGGQQLQVLDRMQLNNDAPVDFILHAGLQPSSETPGVTLRNIGQIQGEVPLESWRASLPAGQTELTLSYGGKIAHDFSARTEAPGKQQRLLAGTISEQGVYLDGSVAWYPGVQSSLQTFSIDISLPPGWSAVSQGNGPTPIAPNKINWRETQPQTDIYLVAGPYQVYHRKLDEDLSAQVYLRQADKQLAERYLEVTRHYLQQYQQMLGDYPYAKFALVENFWETGYGMPSFTLLGPRVIRLPFILHSSYPHEILHNWWGNGVYVDYANGNWSEGLTTYLGDHLINEQNGKGIDYRRNTLQRYASFVREENDFPLVDFRARHNEGSQAVGYGKGMMFFHMLRRELGDEAFIDGLRRFYRDNLFVTAGFEQIRTAFETVSGQDLGHFFRQWLNRAGAPMLSVDQLRLETKGEAYTLHGKLLQTQAAPPFELGLPLLITFENSHAPELKILRMADRSLEFSLELPAKPASVALDPWFDLFRTPDPAEIPSSLSELFGSESALFVLPSGASQAEQTAYRKMAETWTRGYAKTEIRLDHELDTLGDSQAVWLLGRENQFSAQFQQQLSPGQFDEATENHEPDGEKVNIQEQSLVLTRRAQTGQAYAWISATNPDAIPGLARKLPHYGKYSYLAFEGEAPTNTIKGQWAVKNSPLSVSFTDASKHSNPMPPPVLWPGSTVTVH